MLDTLNTSIEGIRYYYSMHSKERVSSERVEILRNTVSNLKKLAAKVQARDLIQVGLEERKIERKGNNDLFLDCSNMIDTLNNSFDIVDF